MTKEEYLQTVYDYFSTNNILDMYLSEVAKQHTATSTRRGDIIDNTLTWSDTSQGHEFWGYHNYRLSNQVGSIRREHRTTCKVTIEYLQSIVDAAQPYEFW
jgi:hypothetical protein